MSTPPLQPAQASASADLSGRQLGDLKLLRRLGRGAMAEVYLAEQSRLKRLVAVKILKPELADDRTYLQRFQREAQAAASLVHANIVQIHEVGHAEGLHYIVQEYIAGLDLRQWMVRHGPADLVPAVSIMRQVAAALTKAADEGVVHRDIKPENILLTPSGEVKVADFGLARQSDSTDLTQVGVTMGTPLYMSPEQVEGKPLDCRSDIYSFGVTCYHMLAGNPPFVGETALGVAVQHLKKEPQPLESLRGDLPPALCGLVHKMMVKDPAGRWQSPRDLLPELRRIQQEHCPESAQEDAGGWESSFAARPTNPRLEATRQLAGAMESAATARPAGRMRLLAAGLALAFAAGGAFAWISLRQTPLLAVSGAGHVRLLRQESALRQYYCASQLGTEEAWRSVLEYFPEKESVVRRAKQQLARIYLRTRDDARAAAIFEEFAAAADADKEFRAYGLAGKAGLLTLEGKFRESADVLDELWPIRGELRDAQMQKMLEHTIRENRSKLGPQTGRQWDEQPDWNEWLDWDEWLEAEFHAAK
jgi:serine/threonine-protein kinase